MKPHLCPPGLHTVVGVTYKQIGWWVLNRNTRHSRGRVMKWEWRNHSLLEGRDQKEKSTGRRDWRDFLSGVVKEKVKVHFPKRIRNSMAGWRLFGWMARQGQIIWEPIGPANKFGLSPVRGRWGAGRLGGEKAVLNAGFMLLISSSVLFHFSSVSPVSGERLYSSMFVF